MNGETWTEYGFQDIATGRVTKAHADIPADLLRGFLGADETIVGRTVTATPWLPVQDQP